MNKWYQNQFVHNCIAHPFMGLCNILGYKDVGAYLHDATLPNEWKESAAQNIVAKISDPLLLQKEVVQLLVEYFNNSLEVPVTEAELQLLEKQIDLLLCCMTMQRNHTI